ncbi:MAG: hypothetical protein SNJ63_02230 [Sphingomonadaceae bacterium]
MRLAILFLIAAPAAACPFHAGFGFNAHGWGEPSAHFVEDWAPAPRAAAPAVPLPSRKEALERQRADMLERYPALRNAGTEGSGQAPATID